MPESGDLIRNIKCETGVYRRRYGLVSRDRDSSGGRRGVEIKKQEAKQNKDKKIGQTLIFGEYSQSSFVPEFHVWTTTYFQCLFVSCRIAYSKTSYFRVPALCNEGLCSMKHLLTLVRLCCNNSVPFPRPSYSTFADVTTTSSRTLVSSTEASATASISTDPAGAAGGAVAATGGAQVSLFNATFQGNGADGRGGGVYCGGTNSSLSMVGGMMKEQEAGVGDAAALKTGGALAAVGYCQVGAMLHLSLDFFDTCLRFFFLLFFS